MKGIQSCTKDGYSLNIKSEIMIFQCWNDYSFAQACLSYTYTGNVSLSERSGLWAPFLNNYTYEVYKINSGHSYNDVTVP